MHVTQTDTQTCVCISVIYWVMTLKILVVIKKKSLKDTFGVPVGHHDLSFTM